VLGGAEGDRLLHAERGLHVGEDYGRRAVGHRRAVGTLERSGDERVLVRGVAAELVGELLLEVRIGILGAVPVRLDGDLGERVGLVAVALEIGRGDLAEDAGKARLDGGLLGDIACRYDLSLAAPGLSSPPVGAGRSQPFVLLVMGSMGMPK